jgi:isoquinoline 1-oxidoreductase beta subunit
MLMESDARPGEAPALSRRRFLAGAGATGMLVLSGGASAQDQRGAPIVLNAWLAIGEDDTVRIMLSQSEMGQGISTTLPIALADELGADWAKVETQWAPFNPAYRHPQYGWMFTGNSESSESFYPIMRMMGAAAREMLASAAAKQLSAEPNALTIAGGVIRHEASGRGLRFGELVAEAAKLPVPASPTLKTAAGLTMIGKPQMRRDIPPKVDGSAVFGIDVKVPGMAIGALRRAPSQGGRLVSYDREAILARKGVITLVEIPSGLVVVADRYWTAKRALDEGKLVFEAGTIAGYSTEGQREDHAERLRSGAFDVKKTVGDTTAKLAAGKALEAVYEIPAQAHATMEPMNCTAHVTADGCELWVPTQGVEITHWVAKEATGLPDDRIVINRTLLGGGFGRRLLADFVRPAIAASKAAQRPVKLIWSREEDFLYDAYRAPMTHAVKATLGPDGKPAAMAHRVVSPSHLLYVFPRPPMKAEHPWDRPIAPPRAYDVMAVEGLVEPLYAISDYKVEQNFVDTPLSVSVWRTTGHGPNNFVLESFLDELAHAAGHDPLAYRLALAKDDARAVAALNAVAEMCRWGRAIDKGHGLGLALAKAFGSYAAQAIEVAVEGRKIKTLNVWTVADFGMTLDPGIATANIEGGVVWGLSGLRTEASFADGELVATNFDGFDPLRMWEMPAIETRLLEGGGKIGGTGEIGPVPTHAAFGNAVFAATGERIRSLPLSRHAFELV